MIDLSKNFEGLMEYPEEFQKKCIELYPNNKEIIDLLSKKSYMLYKKLKELIPSEVTDEEIIEASKKNNFCEVARKYSDRMAKIELCRNFEKLYEEQYLSKGNYIDKMGLVVSDSTLQLRNNVATGKIKIKKDKLKGLPPHFSEKEIKRRNQRRKFGSEEAGKFICD